MKPKNRWLKIGFDPAIIEPMSVCLSSTVYTDVIYLRALSQIDGVGCRVLAPLLQAAGSPKALWEASDAFLRANLSNAKREAFVRRRDEGLDADWLETYEKLGVRAVPCTGADYPALLKEIHDPPLLLYVQGDASVLSGKNLAVVGTRKSSEYGRQATEKLVEELRSAKTTIVSGLAAGIDTVAHWAALKNNLPTVAVFGCGLDVIFPASNQKLRDEILARGGALVSEYPLGTPGNKYTYPQRNRIVAGMSYGTLVIEGDIKSGALITARQALEEGRLAYAVPGNIFNPNAQGPLYLMQSGAMPVSCGEDILKDLNWWNEAAAPRQLRLGDVKTDEATITESAAIPSDLSESEQELLRWIPFDPAPVDQIQRQSGLPSAQVNEILTMLELEGLIVVLPGAKACRK